MSTPGEHLAVHPEERREAILRVISGAREQLILSVFKCDDISILDALSAAALRNVRVRALITKRAKYWGKRLNQLEALLRNMGAEVHRYAGTQRKYHAKYMVADDGPAVIASLNLTRKCFQRTCDFVLTTDEREVVSGIQRLFEADCQFPDAALADLGGHLIAGPDFARARLLEMLGEARTSIRIIDHRLSDPEMGALLRRRREDGIAVQVLGQGALDGLQSHGKMILVDDRLAAIGSISLSPPSLDSRREVAVMVRDPGNVERLRNFFAQHAGAASDSWTAPEGTDDESD